MRKADKNIAKGKVNNQARTKPRIVLACIQEPFATIVSSTLRK
jgi:hypothetical protein